MSDKKKTGAMDFNDPASIDAALDQATAEAAATAATATAPKIKKPKVISVSFTATEDIAAGTTVTFDYEVPVGTSTRANETPLEDMTDAELKIEYRNANSVFYKQKKKGADTTKSGVRLEAVKAALAAKGIAAGSRSTPVDANSVAALIMSGKISAEDIQKIIDAASAPAVETPAEV